VRIGHGAVVCVPEMNHPIRVAERCATLDIISGGRLEVGTARSSTWTELGGFKRESRRHQEDVGTSSYGVLPKMWA
jgi:alkanesulfonate monooxygenase SsuD/methylene tetrahydromethanopterin reductase-like flavin-dependent oxidoreductase (luciferase family)